LVPRFLASNVRSRIQTRFQPIFLCLDDCKIKSLNRDSSLKREFPKSYKLELLRQIKINSRILISSVRYSYLITPKFFSRFALTEPVLKKITKENRLKMLDLLLLVLPFKWILSLIFGDSVEYDSYLL
jgi:CRISPR/Cas system-associated protein Csx1